MPRDVNTKIVIYVQAQLSVTNPDVTTLIRDDNALRTNNEGTKKLLALIAASA